MSDKKKERFFTAILNLKTQADCEHFFNDIATLKEIEDFCDRLEVAQLLADGLTYEEITKKTSMSSTTIARINKSLVYGQGYQKALKKP